MRGVSMRPLGASDIIFFGFPLAPMAMNLDDSMKIRNLKFKQMNFSELTLPRYFFVFIARMPSEQEM
jgi:hypothetical protein